MEDKTRSRNRRDPSLGCSECFGRARQWKTRQDKTRRTKHDTLHLAQPQRSPPRMHRRLQKSTTMEGKTRSTAGARLWKTRQRQEFCESAQSKCTWILHKSLCGKTMPHVLCQPAPSKCTWTCHKRHFIRQFTGKNARAQNRDANFVRACAVEMHLEISQEPLDTEIYRKNARAQNRDTYCVQACAVEMHLDNSQEPLYTEIYRKKCPSPELERRLCASLRRRDAHGHVTIATSYRNLAKKCPSSEPQRKLCASLHNRNALGHFTRATFYGNVQEKCHNRETYFARACAIEMHLQISQEPFYTEICR